MHIRNEKMEYEAESSNLYCIVNSFKFKFTFDLDGFNILGIPKIAVKGLLSSDIILYM